MTVISDKKIICPRCNSDAIYKYGRTKSNRQRYICMLCKKQFTEQSTMKVNIRPICSNCGSMMYTYMKDEEKGIIRFRCSNYPKCKTYISVKHTL